MTKTDSCLCAQPYYGDRCEKIMRGMLDGIFFVNINFVLILSQPACFLSLLKKKKKKKKKEKKRTFVLFCVVVFAKKVFKPGKVDVYFVQLLFWCCL